jgi:hypothetical protein
MKIKGQKKEKETGKQKANNRETGWGRHLR